MTQPGAAVINGDTFDVLRAVDVELTAVNLHQIKEAIANITVVGYRY